MKLRPAAICLILGLSSPFFAWADDSAGWSQTAPADGRGVKTARGWMVPYTLTIPGTEAKVEMLPIPGGMFRMGSLADQGKPEERPQFDVEVEPFWMGKYEITWAQYRPFMDLYDIFKRFESDGVRVVDDRNLADAITTPTKLYEPSFTFEKGDDPLLPAVTMTQYAAKQYTKWLALVTGHGYRLPSEAEWEHACRAGTSTAFHFGDDPKLLDEYGWHYDNGSETTHKVGLKKPNGWGLFDMHGNVSEWVLDQFAESGYLARNGKIKAADAVCWPTVFFPRVVRGGSWDHDPEDCRSASRMPTHDDDWKIMDPNLPLSPWWYTNDPARGVGFRLFRQMEPISAAQRPKVWDADCEAIRDAVSDRLKKGRGVLGLVDPKLPEAMKAGR